MKNSGKADDNICLSYKVTKDFFSSSNRCFIFGTALVEAIRYVDLVIPETNWVQKRTDVHEYHVDAFVMGGDWKGIK